MNKTYETRVLLNTLKEIIKEMGKLYEHVHFDIPLFIQTPDNTFKITEVIVEKRGIILRTVEVQEPEIGTEILVGVEDNQPIDDRYYN